MNNCHCHSYCYCNSCTFQLLLQLQVQIAIATIHATATKALDISDDGHFCIHSDSRILCVYNMKEFLLSLTLPCTRAPLPCLHHFNSLLALSCTYCGHIWPPFGSMPFKGYTTGSAVYLCGPFRFRCRCRFITGHRRIYAIY